jgi:hypothetical protein
MPEKGDVCKPFYDYTEECTHESQPRPFFRDVRGRLHQRLPVDCIPFRTIVWHARSAPLARFIALSGRHGVCRRVVVLKTHSQKLRVGKTSHSEAKSGNLSQ